MVTGSGVSNETHITDTANQSYHLRWTQPPFVGRVSFPNIDQHEFNIVSVFYKRFFIVEISKMRGRAEPCRRVTGTGVFGKLEFGNNFGFCFIRYINKPDPAKGTGSVLV